MSISFEENLLTDIGMLAKKKYRSRSGLVREAARLYVERRNRWDKIFALGEATAQSKSLFERDAAEEIQAYRRRSRKMVAIAHSADY